MECGHPARLDAPNRSISFDADTIAKALVNIYQKKYGNGSPDIEPTLFEKTKEILSGAVNKGVAGQRSGKTSDAFIHALTHSTTVFSVFRVLNMQSKIASYLVDSKGKLKPFGQFVKDVEPYITNQNRQWLQTEYDTTVRRAHLAADWQRFEDEKDVLPNLEWKPSTSPNPGEDHKPYWGTILPIDHEFWNQHRPGDRWNCKCSLRNTDKPATSVPAETVASAQPQKGLDSNPGTTGEIFSTSHPYFPENCGKCPFNKGVGKLFSALVGGEKQCGDCVKVDEICNKNEKKAAFIQQRRQEYEQYKNDPDYVDVEFDENTGGVKAMHKDHNSGKDPQSFFEHLTSDGSGFKTWELENFCIEQLFKTGNSVIVQPEGLPKPHQPGKTETHYTALDIVLNGVRMDIKSITKLKNYYTSALQGKYRQLKNWNKENPNNPADSVMLYFHDPSMFSRVKVKDGITHYLNNGFLYGKHNYIKHVYCVVRGVNRIYQFDVK